MTTWTFKGLAAGAILLALAGCDGTGAPGGSGATTGAVYALPSATLSRGSVTLVPANGFCVDKRSLRARFALLARCDTLGGQGTYGAPLAVITATAIDQSRVRSGATASFGADGEVIVDRRQYDSVLLLQVKGTPPSPDMRDVFWRAVAQVGDQMIGLAIYEAAGGAGIGEQAPDLLRQTMRRTQERTAVVQDNSATSEAKQTLN